VSSYGPCREVRQELAIYVLGAIEPGGRDVVDRHVAGCADCRGELAALAGLPALLRRVPAGEAVALLGGEAGSSNRDDLPSGPVLRQMLARAYRNRRRRVRIRVAAAAAAGLIGGASALAGWQAAHPPAQQTTSAAAGWAGTTRAADPHSGAGATVRYASRPWGLQLSVQVTGIPAGTTCQVRVIGTAAPATPAGGWIISSGRANWYPASSPVPLSEVRGFEVTSGAKLLVTAPIRARAASGPGFGGWPAR
jgi:hypothetical protein